MNKLSKLTKFTFKELKLLSEAWFIFLKWDYVISFRSHAHWRKKVSYFVTEPSSYNPALTSSVQAQIDHIIVLSEIAGRHHLRHMNCLRRCLTQKQLLQKRKFNSKLHLGVKFEGSQLKAHAWLTFQGKVINDTDDIVKSYSELKTMDNQDLLSALK